MISFERRVADLGRAEVGARSRPVGSKDQQRRMGRRAPGGSPAQNTSVPMMEGVTSVTHCVAAGEAAPSEQGEVGRELLKALNASSRHGPQSATPAIPIAASVMPTN